MRVKGGSSRTLLFLSAGLLLAGVLVVGWIWRPWQRPAVTITISLSTDEQGPVELYRRKATFSTSEDAKPLTACITGNAIVGAFIGACSDIRGLISGGNLRREVRGDPSRKV